MKEPNEPGYWWYEDAKEQSIWLVMQDGGITDGAYIYSSDEFDGEWTPVMTPEEIEATLERWKDQVGLLEKKRKLLWRQLRLAWKEIAALAAALEQARAEERERAVRIIDQNWDHWGMTYIAVPYAKKAIREADDD